MSRDADLAIRRALKRVVSLDEAYADSLATLITTARGGHDGKSDAEGGTLRRRSNSSVDIDSDPVVAALPNLMAIREKLLRVKVASAWVRRYGAAKPPTSKTSTPSESKVVSPQSVASSRSSEPLDDQYDRFALRRLGSSPYAFTQALEEPTSASLARESNYFKWKRAILRNRFEKTRQASVDDELARVAALAMRRALLAEQMESRKYETGADDNDDEDSEQDELSTVPGMEIFRRRAGAFKLAFALSVDAIEAAASKWATHQASSKTIKRADASAGPAKQVAIRAANLTSVSCVAYANTSQTLFAVGCDDGSVGVCSTLESGWIALLKGHSAAVTSVEWAEDDTYILTTSVDGSVRLWTNLVADPGENRAQVSTSDSPGAPVLAYPSYDGGRLGDAPPGSELSSAVPPPPSSATAPKPPSVDADAASKWVCVHSFDQGNPVINGTFIPNTNTRLVAVCVSIEQPVTGMLPSTMSEVMSIGGAVQVASVGFGKAKKLLLQPQKMFTKGPGAMTHRTTLRVIDTRNGKEVMANRFNGEITCLTWTKDKAAMYAADNQGMIHVCVVEPDTRRVLSKPFAHIAPVFGRIPGRSLDEYGLADTSAMAQSARIAKRMVGMVGMTRKPDTSEIVYLTSISFKSRDSVYKTPVVVGTDSKGFVRELKCVNGKLDELERVDFFDTTATPTPPKHTYSLSFGKGDNLVIGTDSGDLLILNPHAETPQQQRVARLSGHARKITTIALSADECTMVSGDESGGLAIWHRQHQAETLDDLALPDRRGPKAAPPPARPAVFPPVSTCPICFKSIPEDDLMKHMTTCTVVPT